MKRILLLVACLVTLAACTSETALPDPTGKGSVRMINAIPGSPAVRFLIEELFLQSVAYKVSSAPATYDDFEYRFNFEIAVPGETEFTRIASRTLKVEADREHVFMLTGNINNPTITVWDGDIRAFDDADTVLEVRFSHGSTSLGDIDVYLDPAGATLGDNPPAASLAFGEIADPMDYEAGEYVLTVTAANDINTVHFVGQATDLLARTAHIVTVFDGDANDTSAVAVRSMRAAGNPLIFRDTMNPPKVRFIHASFDTEAVDIYDDEQLTSLVAPNVVFGSATDDLDTTTENRTYYFTPAGSTAQILFEQEILPPAAATFLHVYILGNDGASVAIRQVPDRAPTSTSAKLAILHGAANYPFVDVYLVERGADVTAEGLLFPDAVPYAIPIPAVQLVEGSYDLYLTDADTLDPVSAALPLDLVNGGVVDLISVDTVDPAVVELIEIPIP